MSAVFKFLNTEIALNGTGNTVNLAKVVRVTNANNSLTICTIANTTATYANVTLVPYEVATIEKSPTDTIAGVNLKAVSIAYRN
jgi:hypothetical protein